MSVMSQKAAQKVAKKAGEKVAKRAVGTAAAAVVATTIAAGVSILAVGAVLDYLFADVVAIQKELNDDRE